MTKKRQIIMFLTILFAFNSIWIEAFANDVDDLIEYNIIDKNTLCKDSVSRAECISSIMRILGLTDEYAIQYANRNFEYLLFYDVPNHGHKEEGHIIMAGITKIAYGIYDKAENTTRFYPNNCVTVRECVAFMVRCLDESLSDFDDTYEYAKKEGLVRSSDSFFENENDFINTTDFCILLNRMIHQKRGKYFEREEIEDEDGIYVRYEPRYDTEKSIRYIDQFVQE